MDLKILNVNNMTEIPKIEHEKHFTGDFMMRKMAEVFRKKKFIMWNLEAAVQLDPIFICLNRFLSLLRERGQLSLWKKWISVTRVGVQGY